MVQLGYNKFLSINSVCNGATHGEMTGVGARRVDLTTYDGSTELEKDISCCKKCTLNINCEYWVRATDSSNCWLKTNDGNEVQDIQSSTRRGGLRASGISYVSIFSSSYDVILNSTMIYASLIFF